MSLPISFGVEFEFNLAFLKDPAGKPPSGESRMLVFPPDGYGSGAYENRPRRHLAKLLHSAGFPVDLQDFKGKTMDFWQIDEDATVDAPTEGDPDFYAEYEYIDVELKTPALKFNEKSIQDVLAVCELINKTYVISNNSSSGLHVHIGHFDARNAFPLEYMKKFVSFMYIFDPQICSIHPLRRLHHTWGGSMRSMASVTQGFQAQFGYRPLPAEIIPYFFAAPNLDTLLEFAMALGMGRANNVNMAGVKFAARASIYRLSTGQGHTIEFRQHAGTMEGLKITMWIRVLAGMVKFIEEVSTASFHQLLIPLMLAETWEKTYNGKDDEKEQKLGPIPADGLFTIIDLLEHIGLTEEAQYYNDKWMIHKSDDLKDNPYFTPQKTQVRWEFMAIHSPDSEEYKDGMRLKDIWNMMKSLDLQSEMTKREKLVWDEKSDFWPTHRIT